MATGPRSSSTNVW